MPTPQDDIVELRAPDGSIEYKPRKQVQHFIDRGWAETGATESVALASEENKEEALTSLPAQAKVFGRRLAAGATMGLTDVLDRYLEDEAVLAEQAAADAYNPGVAIAGDVASYLAPAGALGSTAKAATKFTFGRLGVAAGEAVGKKVGAGFGAKVAQEVTESLVFSAGQAVSNVALSTNPLSVEAVASEFVKNAPLAVGLGVGSAGLQQGFQSLAKGTKWLKETTAAAVKEAEHATTELVSKEVRQALTKDFEASLKEVDDAADAMLVSQADDITYRDSIYSYRASKQAYDDAITLLDLSGKATPEQRALIQRFKDGQRKVSEASGGTNALFDRPAVADVGGKDLFNSLDGASRRKLYEGLDEMRTSALELDLKAGGNGKLKWAEFTDETPEQFAVRRDHVYAAAEELSLSDAIPEKQLSKLIKLSRQVEELEEVAGPATRVVNKLEEEVIRLSEKYGRAYEPMTSIGKMTSGFSEAESAAKFAKEPHQKIKAFLEKGMKTPEDVAAGRAAMDASFRQLEESGWALKNGRLSSKSFEDFLDLPPEKAIARAQALDAHLKTLTGIVGDNAASQKMMNAFEQMRASMQKVIPEEATDMSGTQLAAMLAGMEALPDFDGPVDNLLKFYVAIRFASGKGVAKSAKAATLGERLAQGAQSAGGIVDAAKAVNRATGVGGAVTGMLDGLLKKGGKLAQIVGANTARIANGVEQLAKGGAKAAKYSAPTALKIINSYKFGERNEEHKTAREAYKARLEELATIAANPMKARERIHESLADVRKLNMQLGLGVEDTMINDALFLYEKIGKDPGGFSTFGVSRWQPTDEQISTFASYLRGLDPAGVWERVVSGRVTPQEAETMRVRRPQTFAEIQRQVMERRDEIMQKCTFDQRVRLSILYDVPVDPLSSKQTVSFFQEQLAARAAAPEQQPQKLDASKLKPQQPTEAQKLQGR